MSKRARRTAARAARACCPPDSVASGLVHDGGRQRHLLERGDQARPRSRRPRSPRSGRGRPRSGRPPVGRPPRARRRRRRGRPRRRRRRCGAAARRAPSRRPRSRAPDRDSPRSRWADRPGPRPRRAPSSPARICSRVDLPTPLGPTTPRQVVGPTESETSSRTMRPPRSWCRWRATRTAGDAAAREGMESSGTRVVTMTRGWARRGAPAAGHVGLYLTATSVSPGSGSVAAVL